MNRKVRLGVWHLSGEKERKKHSISVNGSFSPALPLMKVKNKGREGRQRRRGSRLTEGCCKILIWPHHAPLFKPPKIGRGRRPSTQLPYSTLSQLSKQASGWNGLHSQALTLFVFSFFSLKWYAVFVPVPLSRALVGARCPLYTFLRPWTKMAYNQYLSAAVFGQSG